MRYCNDSVRRQDRLLDEVRAVEILHRGEYGFLSMVADGGGYGVPVNYAVSGDTIYMHCAPEGRKLQAMVANPRVSFCVVGYKRIVAEEFTTEFESVIASGVARVVESLDERRQALRLIVEKYSAAHLEQGLQAIERSVHRTAVVAIEVENLTGKVKMMR